jgi:hypothetical protein
MLKKIWQVFIGDAVIIPCRPDNKVLTSMALRYDHAYLMNFYTDEQIEAAREKRGEIMALCQPTSYEKALILAQMNQLYEQIVIENKK